MVRVKGYKDTSEHTVFLQTHSEETEVCQIICDKAGCELKPVSVISCVWHMTPELLLVSVIYTNWPYVQALRDFRTYTEKEDTLSIFKLELG